MKNNISTLLAGIALVLSILSPTECKAHTSNAEHATYAIAKKDSVHSFVDKLPEFPGGMQAMVKFLQSEIKYPKACLEQKQEGRALVNFVVNKKGKLKKIKVLKSAGHELLDKEAIRAVKQMPKWIPGEHEGKVVNVQMTLPISFKLRK